MKTVALILPFPPTVNHYYGARGKARFIKPEGVQFRAEVCRIVRSLGFARMDGRLAVYVELFPDSRRRMDVMNREKALSDALTHAGAWGDDSQIDDFRIVRREVIKNAGACKVLITEIKEEQ